MYKKRTYDRNFFKAWSREMAYVLGFLFADGNVVVTRRGNHYVAIYSADKPLLTIIRKILKSNHKIAKRTARSGEVYRIQIGSKEWFYDLSKLGLSPNKSKRMSLPVIPPLYVGDFVRGYFDGDGNVWTGMIHKDRKTQHLTIQTSFTSGSKGFILALRDMLSVHGINGGGIYEPKERHFTRLTLSIKDTLKLYRIMYNSRHKLFLGRKKTVFERFMKCGRGVAG